MKEGDDAEVKPFNDDFQENGYQLREPTGPLPGMEKRNSDFNTFDRVDLRKSTAAFISQSDNKKDSRKMNNFLGPNDYYPSTFDQFQTMQMKAEDNQGASPPDFFGPRESKTTSNNRTPTYVSFAQKAENA